MSKFIVVVSGALLVLASGFYNCANALEFIEHKPINDGTGTTITFEGERVEK